MANRRRTLTEADRADWAFLTREVTPLGGDRASAAPIEPTRLVVAPRAIVSIPPNGVGAGPLRVGLEPGGLDRASWNRLRSGRMVATRRLDLHGMTAQHAFQALKAFLRSAHAEHLRCVEVITGRGATEGTGRLRRELPMWLNLPELRPLVLAATHPHPANPGSVRILLRRTR
jgi:hypothetical protein